MISEQWTKSSYSNGGPNNCVELRDLNDGVAVRDSKFPRLAPQRYSHAGFAAFLASVKSGTFGTN